MLQSFVFLLTISSVSAFNIPRVPVASDQSSTRRNIIKYLGITIGITSISSPANADVIRGARCANGEGDGCDSLAEDNEFIQSLQKKSSENREKNERVSICIQRKSYRGESQVPLYLSNIIYQTTQQVELLTSSYIIHLF